MGLFHKHNWYVAKTKWMIQTHFETGVQFGPYTITWWKCTGCGKVKQEQYDTHLSQDDITRIYS